MKRARKLEVVPQPKPPPQSLEVYPTPGWCVHRLLEAVHLPRGVWLEPCVGAGAIVQAVSELRDDIEWHTVEVRPECAADETANFLQRPILGRAYDVGLMNPPFSKALQFASVAMRQCTHVAMLQRLNWLASEERASWLRDNPPGVYVLPNRPSFVGPGTDAQEYAWYVWPPQHRTVQVLRSTPISERTVGDRPRYVKDTRQLPLFGGTTP
jgi:hypothetical protein